MKKQISFVSILVLLVVSVVNVLAADRPPGEFYELRVYHFETQAQENTLDQYLRDAFIPAARKSGISHVGVFKPIANDTATSKKLIVLIPVSSLQAALELEEKILSATKSQPAAKTYLEALYSNPPYRRMEKILLKAFQDMPQHKTSGLTNAKEERVYELRSYEGHTEAINKNKIEMFNEGGEIKLFVRLEFNAIFYGEVIFGSRMPNLMYMTSFANMEARNDHWKKFGADPEWKKISTMPQYQNNVSRNEITLLKAVPYSDL